MILFRALTLLLHSCSKKSNVSMMQPTEIEKAIITSRRCIKLPAPRSMSSSFLGMLRYTDVVLRHVQSKNSLHSWVQCRFAARTRRLKFIHPTMIHETSRRKMSVRREMGCRGMSFMHGRPLPLQCALLPRAICRELLPSFAGAFPMWKR